jgi:hypothetical protein
MSKITAFSVYAVSHAVFFTRGVQARPGQNSGELRNITDFPFFSVTVRSGELDSR